MNRRQRIIVSITGIFLVLLILLGLTYGYFLSRIQGNTKDKSVEVTTADLLLVYEDGDGDIIKQENIAPGTEVGSKTFSVVNKGEIDAESKYVVVIDNVKITDKKNGTSTTFESNDFVYTLTCKSNQDNKTCEGRNEEIMFPITNDGILMVNTIGVNETQTYTLTVKYKETGKDQSKDMGKKLEARVNIKDLKDINPYSDKTETLAYKIINNARTTETGTPIKIITDTKPIVKLSRFNEKELSIEPDDYGVVSYYYRGNVEDNYVQFANMCWRVVRIQGDGSVKLILANGDSSDCNYASVYAKDEDGKELQAHYGYKIVEKYDLSNYYVNDYINSEQDNEHSARTQLMSWLERKIKEPYLNKLKDENWCIGDLTYAYYDEGRSVGYMSTRIYSGWSFYYSAGNRFKYLKTPKLKCETTGKYGEIDTNKIGMLTMDEVVFAGGAKGTNTSYYLYNNGGDGTGWWTLSPSIGNTSQSYAFRVLYTGSITDDKAFVHHDSYFLRPVVSLVPGVSVKSGDGTSENPYIIAD